MFELLGNFLWIAAGGAWSCKELINENLDNMDDVDRNYHIKEYVSLSTDEDLERKVTDFVNDPKNQEQAWILVETFKRDNPMVCFLEDFDITHNKDGNLIGVHGDWDSIGVERALLFSKYGSVYAANKNQYEFMENNRNNLINLIMQTYSKYTRSYAQFKAQWRVYKLKKSRSSWQYPIS